MLKLRDKSLEHLAGEKQRITPARNMITRDATTNQYRSEALASIHETMEALHELGAIDKQTMREFDDSCLTPPASFPPEAMRALREREHRSQPVFARYLNVSKNLISDWERGVKRPGGPALRLPTVIEKHGIQSIA
ncbi:transcriptional regulator [Allochromatium tepidum]|uniref:Transcriptional regulator n=1 Tax=Allochromatium tepidum TaxID=553982 RepID=A0ABM7QIJ4_9GAMM|nr:transcriptional regulator [Allochromatium tepidum]